MTAARIARRGWSLFIVGAVTVAVSLALAALAPGSGTVPLKVDHRPSVRSIP